MGWGGEGPSRSRRGNLTLSIDGNKRVPRVGRCRCDRGWGAAEPVWGRMGNLQSFFSKCSEADTLRESLENKDTAPPQPHQRSHCQNVPEVVRSLA